MKLDSINKKQIKRLIYKVLFPWSSKELGSNKKHKWSIGIYSGQSPFDFNPIENISNPVLTEKDVSDCQAEFVADPFMVKVNNLWYMFFEVMNRQTRKGEIGLATSEDGLNWSYQQIVLSEPFHLSYPYIFEWMNNYYMIPETHQARSVRLYKAINFPSQWVFVDTLISGHLFSDASIFRYNNQWWLFTETNPNYKFDTLRLYYADDLMGPWVEHPKSSIYEGNPHISRPAGKVLIVDNKIIRYTQDCYPDYGTKVQAFEITELTTTNYQERKVTDHPILQASGRGWNESGMHHIDAHPIDKGQWIACVDGWVSV